MGQTSLCRRLPRCGCSVLWSGLRTERPGVRPGGRVSASPGEGPSRRCLWSPEPPGPGARPRPLPVIPNSGILEPTDAQVSTCWRSRSEGQNSLRPRSKVSAVGIESGRTPGTAAQQTARCCLRLSSEVLRRRRTSNALGLVGLVGRRGGCLRWGRCRGGPAAAQVRAPEKGAGPYPRGLRLSSE